MVRKYILLMTFPNTNTCLLKTDSSNPNSSFRNKQMGVVHQIKRFGKYVTLPETGSSKPVSKSVSKQHKLRVLPDTF
jgi:hypothetical protein